MRSLFQGKTFSSKVFKNAAEAIKDMRPGVRILLGGFGLAGLAENCLTAVSQRKDLKNLEVVCCTAGTTDLGPGLLMKNKQVKRVISSYVGENQSLMKQYLAGELEVELCPQGTLCERLRSGGAGIPAFFTPTGYGTVISDGGQAIKLKKDGKTPEIKSAQKEVREFNGRKYVMEHTMTGDYAFVKGWKGDTKGNVIFRKTARNYNPDCAKAAKCAIVEVEELVQEGQLDPDQIHLPGVYTHRIFQGSNYVKPIEVLTLFKEESAGKKLSADDIKRNKIAQRAAMEIKNGMYVNLGIGIPTLVGNYLPKGVQLVIQSENGMLGNGPFPRKGLEDPDLINASKQTTSELPGCCYFSSSDSFAMIRGRKMDITILGSLQVSRKGDIANWIVPGKIFKGMGGAMDLVGSGSKVVVVMEHTSKGESKIFEECKLPLTGKGVVSKLITDMAVFDFHPQRGMILTELFKGVSLEQVKAVTPCKFEIAENLKTLSF